MKPFSKNKCLKSQSNQFLAHEVRTKLFLRVKGEMWGCWVKIGMAEMAVPFPIFKFAFVDPLKEERKGRV